MAIICGLERIINGPNNWALIIDSLARRGAQGAQVVFKVKSKLADCPVIITGLKWDWYVMQSYQPREELSSREMEKILGKKFDWNNAWWFEGHHGRAFPVWGIYNSISRKGILCSQYIGEL